MAGLGIRLFTDAMIDLRPAVNLRRLGYDVQSCQEAGRSNRGISDHRQLSYATQQGRAILTFNRRDYRRLDRVEGQPDRAIWQADSQGGRLEGGGWRPSSSSSARMARIMGRFMPRAATVARPTAVSPRTRTPSQRKCSCQC